MRVLQLLPSNQRVAEFPLGVHVQVVLELFPALKLTCAPVNLAPLPLLLSPLVLLESGPLMVLVLIPLHRRLFNVTTNGAL
jgi:hypothetical protein